MRPSTASVYPSMSRDQSMLEAIVRYICIHDIPQKFGSSSSTKGPRGSGYCSWKCANALAARERSPNSGRYFWESIALHTRFTRGLFATELVDEGRAFQFANYIFGLFVIDPEIMGINIASYGYQLKLFHLSIM